MKLSDFYNIAKYINKHTKSYWTQKEIQQNSENYFEEYKISNKQGSPTLRMKRICKILIGINDVDANEYIDCINFSSNWSIQRYYCSNCNRMEIIFFSEKDIKNFGRKDVPVLLQDQPQWFKDSFRNKNFLCHECTKKFINRQGGEICEF